MKKAKIDYVFIPNKKEIFRTKNKMKIKINIKDKILCGKFRAGHFEGVLGVINQLLKTIKAKYMFLGEKDYQQVYLIKKFIKKKFNTKVVECKTLRDKNSFPYSSRNFLLKKYYLLKASKISNKIKNFKNQINKNFKNINKLEIIKKDITKIGVNIEYLEIRNKYNLTNNINKQNFKIFVAYYINNVRLIDNF